MSWPPKENTFTEPRDLNEESLVDACVNLSFRDEDQLMRSWKAYTAPSIVGQMNDLYLRIKSQRTVRMPLIIDDPWAEAHPDPHQRSLTKEK